MKVLLLDADGVTLKKEEYFSERFAREYSIPVEDVVPFFKNEFRLCQQGKLDVKEVLAEYLPKWGWEKTVEDFLDYWFTSDTHPDEDIFAVVAKIRESGNKCYLVSDQEKYRAQYIREHLKFDERLDGCFFSHEFGFSKSEPEFFQMVLEKLGVEPSDVVYLDDDEKNVGVAKALGVDARLYSGIGDLKSLNYE